MQMQRWRLGIPWQICSAATRMGPNAKSQSRPLHAEACKIYKDFSAPMVRCAKAGGGFEVRLIETCIKQRRALIGCETGTTRSKLTKRSARFPRCQSAGRRGQQRSSQTAGCGAKAEAKLTGQPSLHASVLNHSFCVAANKTNNHVRHCWSFRIVPGSTLNFWIVGHSSFNMALLRSQLRLSGYGL